jgi:hypothetical protein
MAARIRIGIELGAPFWLAKVRRVKGEWAVAVHGDPAQPCLASTAMAVMM